MLSLVQTTLKHLYSIVIQPDQWSVDDPNAIRGIGNVAKNQTGRWARNMIEVPVLSQKIEKDSQPGLLNSRYVLQYRSVFRFPGSLKYDQLPMRQLTDIAEYLTFLIQTHPDLLTKSPNSIDGYNNTMVNTPHVDPCLHAPNLDPIRDQLMVHKLSVNSFIPIAELSSSDWLVTIVWSIELTIQGTVTAYRQYFEEVFDGSQIDLQPGLTGGLINYSPNRIKLNVFNRETQRNTLAHKPENLNVITTD
jgi:hypothetical protein